jgi:hypothetical protein
MWYKYRALAGAEPSEMTKEERLREKKEKEKTDAYRKTDKYKIEMLKLELERKEMSIQNLIKSTSLMHQIIEKLVNKRDLEYYSEMDFPDFLKYLEDRDAEYRIRNKRIKNENKTRI